MKPMTAHELLKIARNGRPLVRYAVNPKETAIAAYSEALKRFQPVAALGIDGNWYEVPGELLINGKPCHGETWIEN